MYDIKIANKKTAEESTQLIISTLLTLGAAKLTKMLGYEVTADVLFAFAVMVKVGLHRLNNLFKTKRKAALQAIKDAKKPAEKKLIEG